MCGSGGAGALNVIHTKNLEGEEPFSSHIPYMTTAELWLYREKGEWNPTMISCDSLLR